MHLFSLVANLKLRIANPLNAQLLSGSGYGSNQAAPSNYALQSSNFNNPQNAFYNNQQQVYPSTQLIQPNINAASVSHH